MNAPHPHQISEAATLAAFADAIRAAGLTPPELIEADGAIHRFSSSGKRGDTAGRYCLHMDGVTPAGWFQCWRTMDRAESWSAKSANEMTPAEQAAHRQRVEAMQAARKADQEQRQQQAKAEAVRRWEAAAPAQDHPYLKRKGIQAHGTRVEGDRLLIPMHLTEGGTLQSLQVIDFAGGKRFLPGGRVKGCFFLIGERDEIERDAELVICEGFATGASIREATGYPVAVAFNAGNLEAVALALRSKYPGARLILAADDDWRTEGNPGLDKATEAARAVGAWLAVPRFPESCRPDVATDFNDLHKLAGLEAVRECFTAALATEAVTPAPAVRIPGEDGRPTFLVLDDWHEHDGTRFAPGVWHFGIKPGRKADDPPSLNQQRICGPLHVEAVTTDTQDGNYGRLLRLKTSTGRWKSWAMPMAMLRGDGSDLRGELLSMGLEIEHRGREQLAAYLLHRAPGRVITCAVQTGWAGPGRDAFVLPDVVVGPQADGVTYQSDHAGADEYTTRGTLAGWQAGTAALAVNNPMLVLALCTAFAGPLLAIVGADSGGINCIGGSSKGKSSMLAAACSVWGSPSYRRNWRATSNGLEAVAQLFNDSLLALDEISQCDPREVGEITYLLGNGTGKSRAARSGGARSVARWRVSILSNGERSIEATMAEAGFKTKAGQAVRIIDLPVTDQAHGAWDNLHQYPSGAALSDALRREAETHYGHAGRAFLERLTRDDHERVRELLTSIKELPEFNADGGEGQFQRVAARFAVLALAGELATLYGVTGWPEGEAIRAAAVGLRLWLGMRDGKTTDAEGPQVVDQITEFIERHGDSRFSDADAEHSQPVKDRAGWWRQRDGARVFLFTAAGMRDALRGFDYRRALLHLEQAGMLRAPNARGDRQDSIRIHGTKTRIFTVKPVAEVEP